MGSATEYVTAVVPSAKMELLAVEAGDVRVKTALQLSKTVGAEYATLALHRPNAEGWGLRTGQVIAGGSASTMVMSKLQVAWLPDVSVTWYTEVVRPTGKLPPDAMPLVMVKEAIAQLSLRVGVVYVATALQTPASVLSWLFAGHAIIGSSLSVTVTVNVQLFVLPDESMAWYKTVEAPKGNGEPDAVPESNVTELTRQLSVAVASTKVGVAVQTPVAVLRGMLAGHVIAGGSMSTTLMVNEHKTELP